MKVDTVVLWMLNLLERDTCLYQDDVADYLIKNNANDLLKENADGNVVLNNNVLNAFKKATENNVVWVRSGFYWRYRVAEDEPGRNARG
jgi:hypothetical protein